MRYNQVGGGQEKFFCPFRRRGERSSAGEEVRNL